MRVHELPRRVLPLLFALVLAPAAWAGGELTAQLGLRLGGGVDRDSGNSKTVDGSLAYGLTFDIPLGEKHEKFIAVLWSRQDSEATVADFQPTDAVFDLTIDYLHAGGVYRPVPGKGKAQGFVMFTAGVTLVGSDESGFGSDVVPSLMIGGGGKFPIKEKLAFRLDGRMYINIDDARLSGFCGGVSCSIHFGADGALQFDLLAGISFEF